MMILFAFELKVMVLDTERRAEILHRYLTMYVPIYITYWLSFVLFFGQV